MPSCRFLVQGRRRERSHIAFPHTVLPEQPNVLHGLQRPRNVETRAELQAVVRAQRERGKRVRKLLSGNVSRRADGRAHAIRRAQRQIPRRVESSGRSNRADGTRAARGAGGAGLDSVLMATRDFPGAQTDVPRRRVRRRRSVERDRVRSGSGSQGTALRDVRPGREAVRDGTAVGSEETD